MKKINLFFTLCLFGVISIAASAIPNNTIYYTSSDGNVVNPYSRNAFGGATIVSNEYSNGQGIITFDRDVTSIGKSAFRFREGLTSVTIPQSVTEIGESAFSNCSGLTSVYISDLDKWAEIEFGSGMANPLYYAHNLYLNGQLVTEAKLTTSKKIGSYAFNYCSGLTSVTIGNSVTSIGEYAFEGCDNVKELIYAEGTKTVLRTYLTSITSVTIPNSVTSIGYDAFYNCSGLTSVTIPNSVTSIDADAFYCCFGLKGVNITDLDKWAEIEFGDDSANPLHYAHNLYLNGQLVTEAKLTTSKKIGSYAFNYCSGLTSVTIPNSVTSIGSEAFSGCNNVKELIYAEGTKTVLRTYLTSITSVTIPNSVTSIGSSAFSDCSGLISVTIPNSVTSIDADAFYCCFGLISVTIPNSVTSIEDHVFSGCNYGV